MIEKVNPSHPDKIADRIAGALVDLAYTKQENPRIAVEVLIGHGKCHIIAETSVHIDDSEVLYIVNRITQNRRFVIIYDETPQDRHLSDNQSEGLRCGDNGIFRGEPLTREERLVSEVARSIYDYHPYDGKYIYAEGDGISSLVVCQSNASQDELDREIDDFIEDNGIPSLEIAVNPLGFWTGGTDVDTGATNRKLGSDMGHSVTGGGLHGKDLSKADVSVNIFAFLLAQSQRKPVEFHCAIGDRDIDGIPYSAIVETARAYIKSVGGFEKFAEWGLF